VNIQFDTFGLFFFFFVLGKRTNERKKKTGREKES